MKILHFIFSFTTGGAEYLLSDLVRDQLKSHKVSVIIFNDLIDESMVKALPVETNLYLINRKPGSFSPIKLLKFIRLVNRIKPDVIHCHNETAISLISFFKAKKVHTIHDVQIPLKGLEKFDVNVAISEAVQEDILKRSLGKIVPVLINNGVPLELIAPKDSPKDETRFKIIQISRLLHEKKGQDVLIKALNNLVNSRKIKNVYLDFVGVGPSLNFLENLVKEYKLESHITFLGSKNREWIYNNLQYYDLLVQPSRYEGFGLTVIEAMAAKLPCLVSSVDGPIKLIEHGKYGFSFRNEDANDCSNQIMHIKQNDNILIRNMVNDAYDHVSNNYSSHRMNLDYEKLYAI